MSRINYKELDEITVKSQEELDMIPLDFKGQIYIEFGTYQNKAIVKNSYYKSVVARDNSSVTARNNSSVTARNNSSVTARDNSSVTARNNSSVEAYENSSVEARNNSSVVARENSSVTARDNSSVTARNNSSVTARDNSSVTAWNNSSVEAYENSSVEAWDNSSVEAWGNCQVVDMLQNAKIKISGNARIVYMPKNIYEFMNFYGIKHDKKTAVFYKAVRKINDEYCADYDNDFKYIIGETKIEINLSKDVENDCGEGIHISHLNWALKFGSNWSNLAILEVEVDIDNIVLPKDTDGKVRTNKVKVLREVSLEECGIYGKIIAKRLEK